jgi:hypothetical protein
MGANFVDLEQVDFVCIICSIELPQSVYLATKAVNWLVSSHLFNKAKLVKDG